MLLQLSIEVKELFKVHSTQEEEEGKGANVYLLLMQLLREVNELSPLLARSLIFLTRFVYYYLANR